MKVFKNNRNHWQANSHIELDNSRLLRIVTMKTYSGVITTQAMVMHREKQGITSHSPFSDYSRLINKSKARCTEKLVTDLHIEAIKNLDDLRIEAIKNLDDLRIEAVNHYQGANHV